MMMKGEKKGIILLLLTTVIWGLAFVFVQMAIDAGWQTFPILLMRGIIGGVFCLILSFKYRWWKHKKTIISGIIMGILLFLGYAFQTFGQKLSTPINSAFITSLNIIFVPILLWLLFRIKPTFKIYLACLIGLIGTAILSFTGGIAFHLGDILLVICAVIFAFQIIYVGRVKDMGHPISVATVYLFTMAFCSLIGMFVFKETTIPKTGWIGVLYAGIFSSAIATIFQFAGQKLVETRKAGLILAQEAVVGTIASIIIFKDPFTWNVLVGGLLMILSVVIVEARIKKRKKKNSKP